MKTANLGPGLDVDVAQLIKSRLLVQANSGGGKSWTLRRLCEQTFGLVQHIIIDPESEFYTLREKHDYALFGKGGDGPADLKSAPLLARRLLELGLSAVIDISELGGQRAAFVKAFLEALVDAPRALWHPVLVVIDEAHKFCPEKGRGESVSTAAVIDLMTRGRKRGFCGVLATQRVSKLNKDAAAECNNKLIGRCSLDVDRKRAGEELGFTDKREVMSLRDLDAGSFYAWGPALSKDICQVQIGKVQTTHPGAGEIAPPPAPPHAKVKKLLDELANLPREAEEETKNLVELRGEIRQLKLDLKKAQSSQKTEVIKELTPLISHRQVAHLEKTAKRITEDTDRLEKAAGYLDRMRDRLAQAQQAIVSELGNLKTEIRMQSDKVEKSVLSNLPPSLRGAAQMIAQRPQRIGEQQHPKMGTGRMPPPPMPNDSSLGKGEVAILTALIQYPAGLSGKQLSVITGYVQQSRDTYISKLVGRGLVSRDQPGHVVAQQPAASQVLPVIEPLPSGEALQDYWFKKLSKGEAAILRVLVAAHPEAVAGPAITEATGYVQQSRDTYISKMVGKEIIARVKPGWVRASDALFE